MIAKVPRELPVAKETNAPNRPPIVGATRKSLPPQKVSAALASTGFGKFPAQIFAGR